MSIYNTKKSKTGRPPVDSEAVTVRLRSEVIARIDDWRRDQPDLPGRPEAIRRLVDAALNEEDAPRGILPDHLYMLDRFIAKERPGCSRVEAMQVITSKFLAERKYNIKD
jgi:hypothetical protein